MSFHLKYRPQTLDEFIGNPTTVESLQSIIKSDDPPHCYLFHGPSGCGKTTLGRILANSFGCSEHDLKEYNSSNTRGIDTAREIIQNSKYKPLSGSVRVYLLDEVHQTTKDFQNAMLKILEDTPSHCYFILCTTEPDRLLTTIRNRCSTFPVAKLASKTLMRLLRSVCQQEEIEIDKEIKQQIANGAEGSPRQALVLLEQIAGSANADINKLVAGASIQNKQVLDLCRALLDGRNWKTITSILKGLDEEPEKVRRAVLGYFNKVALNNTESAIMILEAFEDNFYDSGQAGLTLACYRAMLEMRAS